MSYFFVKKNYKKGTQLFAQGANLAKVNIFPNSKRPKNKSLTFDAFDGTNQRFLARLV